MDKVLVEKSKEVNLKDSIIFIFTNNILVELEFSKRNLSSKFS